MNETELTPIETVQKSGEKQSEPKSSHRAAPHFFAHFSRISISQISSFFAQLSRIFISLSSSFFAPPSFLSQNFFISQNFHFFTKFFISRIIISRNFYQELASHHFVPACISFSYFFPVVFLAPISWPLSPVSL